MINHAAEVWLALFAAFAVGSLLGWLVYRWIDRSDYAFDQRELSGALGRRFGRGRTADETDEADTRPLALAAAAEPADDEEARPTPRPQRTEPARPTRRETRRARRQAAKRQAPAETNAAETLRERVRGSSLAASWRASRKSRDGDVVAEKDTTIIPPSRPRQEAGPEPAADHWSGMEPRYPIPEPPQRLRPASKPSPAKPVPDEEWEPTAGAWPPTGDSEWPVLARPSVPQLTDGRSAGNRGTLVPVLAPPVGVDEIWSGGDAAADAKQADPEIVAAAGLLTEAPVSDGDADRPPLLAEPPGDPDDLKKIKGIGQAFEKKLNQLGIHRYSQVAEWTPAQQKWVGGFLGIAGRIERDDWSGQAAGLVAEADAKG